MSKIEGGKEKRMRRERVMRSSQYCDKPKILINLYLFLQCIVKPL